MNLKLAVAILFSALTASARELPAQVEDQCEAQGGCAWVSRDWVEAQKQQAWHEGAAAAAEDARVKCRNRL